MTFYGIKGDLRKSIALKYKNWDLKSTSRVPEQSELVLMLAELVLMPAELALMLAELALMLVKLVVKLAVLLVRRLVRSLVVRLHFGHIQLK